MTWEEHLARSRSYPKARRAYMRDRGWTDEDWYHGPGRSPAFIAEIESAATARLRS